MKAMMLIIFFGIGPDGGLYHDSMEIPMSTMEHCESQIESVSKTLDYPGFEAGQSMTTSVRILCVKIEE